MATFNDCMKKLTARDLEVLDDSVLREISDRATQPNSNAASAIQDIIDIEQVDLHELESLVRDQFAATPEGKKALADAAQKQKAGKSTTTKELEAKKQELIDQQPTVHGLPKARRVKGKKNRVISKRGMSISEDGATVVTQEIEGTLHEVDGIEVVIANTAKKGKKPIYTALEPNTGMVIGENLGYPTAKAALEAATLDIQNSGGGAAIAQQVSDALSTTDVVSITQPSLENGSPKPESPAPAAAAKKPSPPKKATTRKAKRIQNPSVEQVSDEFSKKPLGEFSNKAIRVMIRNRVDRILAGKINSKKLIGVMLDEVRALIKEIESRNDGVNPVTENEQIKLGLNKPKTVTPAVAKKNIEDASKKKKKEEEDNLQQQQQNPANQTERAKAQPAFDEMIQDLLLVISPKHPGSALLRMRTFLEELNIKYPGVSLRELVDHGGRYAEFGFAFLQGQIGEVTIARIDRRLIDIEDIIDELVNNAPSISEVEVAVAQPNGLSRIDLLTDVLAADVVAIEGRINKEHVRKELQSLFDTWSSELNIASPTLRVIRNIFAGYQPANHTIKLSTALAALAADPLMFSGQEFTYQGQTYKFSDTELKAAQILVYEILAHEYGHHIQRVSLNFAPSSVLKEILAAYDAWVDSLPADRMQGARNKAGGTTLAAFHRIGELARVTRKEGGPNHFINFEEWFADQIAAVAFNTNHGFSKSTRSFFEKLYDRIRAFLARMTIMHGAPQPDQAIVRYIESLKTPAPPRFTAANRVPVIARTVNAGRSIRTRVVGGKEVPITIDDDVNRTIEDQILKDQNKELLPSRKDFVSVNEKVENIERRLEVLANSGVIDHGLSIRKGLSQLYDFVLKHEVGSLTSILPSDYASALSAASAGGHNRGVANRVAAHIPGAKALNTGLKDKFGKNIWVVYLESNMGVETPMTSEDIEALSTEAGLEPGTMSQATFGAFDGVPSDIIRVLVEALRNGREKNPGKIEKTTSSSVVFAPKGGKGSRVRVDVGKIRELGAVVDESTRDSSLSKQVRMARQYLAGLAYLMDTLDAVPEGGAVNPKAVIHPAKGRGAPFTVGDALNAALSTGPKEEVISIDALLSKAGRAKNAITDKKLLAEAKKLLNRVRLTASRIKRVLKDRVSKEEFDSILKARKEARALVPRLDKVLDRLIKRANLPKGAIDEHSLKEETTPLAEVSSVSEGTFEGKLDDKAEGGHTFNETEAQQQRKSVRDGKEAGVKRKNRTLQEMLGRRQVEGSDKRLVAVAQAILDKVGIRTQVDIMFPAEIRKEIAKIQQELGHTKNAERRGVLQRRVDGLNWLLGRKDGAIYAFDDEQNAIDRIPVIMIDPNVGSQTTQLIHELGHLIEYSALRTAPPEVVAELSKAFDSTGLEPDMFSEWFAEQLKHWVGRRGIGSSNSKIAKFFDRIIQMLRSLYDILHPEAYSVFEDFIDALHQTGGKVDSAEPATPLGKTMVKALEGRTLEYFVPYVPNPTRADFSPEVRQRSKRMISWFKNQLNSAFFKSFGEGLTAITDITIRTADAYLRNIGLPEFANNFHLRPDVKGENRRETVFQEMRIEGGKWQNKMREINNLYPRTKRWYAPRRGIVDKQSKTYLAVQEALMAQTSLPQIENKRVRRIVRETRGFYKQFHKFLTDNGMSLGYQPDYVPMMVDTVAWQENQEEIIKRLQSIGYTEAEAEQAYFTVQRSRGETADGGIRENVLTGPSFSSARHRFFGPKEHEVLKEFYRTDMPSVSLDYMHNAIKRMVIQRRFGEQAGTEMVSINGVDTEVPIIDPIRKLERELLAALDGGKITPEQYERIRGKVLPAYFGRLGSSMSDPLRRLSSFAIVYQNIRLLSLALLPSLIDPIHVLVRSQGLNGRWADVRDSVAALKNKDDMYRTAEFLGFIRDDMTEAALNDPVEAQFFSPNTRAFNEWFFRANGLHQLTQFSRVFGLVVGKRYISEHAYDARNGNEKSQEIMRELGLDHMDVIRWDRAGRPMSLDSNRRIIGALHQFVDEAIMRPDSATRPVWGSDQRMQVVFHLKSFIFSYHETILRRIFSDIKSRGLSHRALIPLIPLVAMVIPMSMAMYELRRRITHFPNTPSARGSFNKDPVDFVWEGIQRSGMIGMLQFAVDAEMAQSHGQMALWSLAGPSAAQFQEFVMKDFDSFVLRAIPIVAQSVPLRGVISESLGG